MRIIPLIFTLIFISLSLPAMSSVSVVFKESKKFADYELTGESRPQSLQTLQKNFSGFFGSLSKAYFSEGQKMEIIISNIDLAGDMLPNTINSGRYIRVVKGHAFIQLNFTYKVTDISGELIKEGEYKLNNIIKNGSSHIIYRRYANISHFVKPLKNWFSSTFK